MLLERDALCRYWEEKEAAGDVLESDCEAIEYLLDHCRMEFSPASRFFCSVNCAWINSDVVSKRAQPYREEAEALGFTDAVSSLAYSGYYDFGHTSPRWEDVFSLGFEGLRRRAEGFSESCEDGEKRVFYNGVIRVYSAAQRFVLRAAAEARTLGRDEMAEGLESLAYHPPKNLFEALQLTLVFYTLQCSVEGTVLRTMGRLDQLLYPFLRGEEDACVRELLDDYLCELDAIEFTANVPFAICGTDDEGRDSTNPMSYHLLDAYQRGSTNFVKLHFLCSEKTPEDIVRRAFEGIRSGKNSIVFMSDERVIESLIKQGADPIDARRYHVVGCYECGAAEEITCSCNGFLNLAKALEYALNDGVDVLSGKRIGLPSKSEFESFEALLEELERQLAHLCDSVTRMIDLYERGNPYFHSAPFLSGTYLSSLESGRDVYRKGGAKYNNSSVNVLGIATVTDSLAAIKSMVFDRKMLSLAEMREILRANWKGHERLRLIALGKMPKYGSGDMETDLLARRITDFVAHRICGRQNTKGGVYRLGTFSINYRWNYGKGTAASADGRFDGDTLSQNADATFGCDRGGVTAHLLSVTRSIDTSNTPNGTVVDIDFHTSAVRGENGMNALVATLRSYFANGGFAVHYNVLDTEILKAARKEPEKYSTLQVRVCGWNAAFTSLSDVEKDEFIERSER